VSGFKFLLMLRGGEPPDPACFVTAVPNWHEGETFMVAGGKRFRILGITTRSTSRGSRRWSPVRAT
jgi:hypothetical protein